MESISGTQVLLRREIVDRVLVARLIDEPPSEYVFSPFQYLLHCYANVYQQARSLPSRYRNAQLLQRLNATVVDIKDLILSYAALVFMPDVIPAVRTACFCRSPRMAHRRKTCKRVCSSWLHWKL